MKKLLSILLLVTTLLAPVNVFGYGNRVVDNADVLSENEEIKITNQLDVLSDKYGYDIVVYLSVDTSFGDDIVSEGCEFFDNNGYGYGSDHKGLLLIVNYETSKFDVITTGDEVRNKYDGYIEDCYDAIQPYLRNDISEAINIFETWIDTRFISSDINYDDKQIIKSNEESIVRDILISGIVSIVVCVVVGLVLKRQLRSEGKKHGATNYIDKNSFSLTRSGDIFLYRTTTRSRIKTDDTKSSGGGGFSISHTSSSGISHGSGGGRSF